jgi:phosphatidylinositol-3,4,5-trisphosphate 3-phosphatase/dual-specificity protein phosphatase PTEN
LPSPGFQVEVVLVDHDGSQPPKQKVADRSADKKYDADSSMSSSAKENDVHVESNKEAGGDDKDDVFSDNEAEDRSFKGKKEKVSSSGQGSSNAVKASETSVVQNETSAAYSGIEKLTISIEQGARAPDATSLKTEASSKSSSTTTQPPAVESSSMSEFKAIAADASVFSFGDEDEYESE